MFSIKKPHKLIIFLAVFVAFTAFDLAFLQQTSKSQPADMELGMSSQCGGGMPQTTFIESDIAGKALYIRTTTNDGNKVLTLYTQGLADGTCQQLASVTAGSSNWTMLPVTGSQIPPGSQLIIDGGGLSSDPYASSVEILLVEPKSCQPSSACMGVYKGKKALFDPIIISGSSIGSVSMLEVKSIEGQAVKKVEYYSNDTFRYEKSELEPFNRKYLDGGKHTLKRVVYFENGQKIFLSESIDMGASISPTQWFMSWYYRLGNEIKLGVVVAALAFTLAAILATVRAIYKRHTYRKNHGLSK